MESCFLKSVGKTQHSLFTNPKGDCIMLDRDGMFDWISDSHEHFLD